MTTYTQNKMKYIKTEESPTKNINNFKNSFEQSKPETGPREIKNEFGSWREGEQVKKIHEPKPIEICNV